MIKAIAISGGGSKGAFATAVESIEKINYDLLAGSSAGALAILMIAQGKQDEAVEFHKKVTNAKIYDQNPFNRNFKLKKGKIVVDIIRGKDSFSTTSKLQQIIRDNYSEKAHNDLKLTKEIVVVVTNMNTREPVYISNKDYDWEDFTFWVWVSTLAYPFANTVTVKENGEYVKYADGGFSVSLPVGYVCKRSKNVRAIVLNEEKENIPFENDNPVEGMISMIDVLLATNLKKDIGYGYHFVDNHDVDLEYIFMPNKVAKQPMNFIPSEAKEMIRLGKACGKFSKNYKDYVKFKQENKNI